MSHADDLGRNRQPGAAGHGPDALAGSASASRRYSVGMNTVRRITVRFDPDLHRALREKAALSSRSISSLVNDAVRDLVAEDAADQAAFDERAAEPLLDFGAVTRSLRKRGRI